MLELLDCWDPSAYASDYMRHVHQQVYQSLSAKKYETGPASKYEAGVAPFRARRLKSAVQKACEVCADSAESDSPFYYSPVRSIPYHKGDAMGDTIITYIDDDYVYYNFRYTEHRDTKTRRHIFDIYLDYGIYAITEPAQQSLAGLEDDPH
jgi:hypothetical protein